MMCLFSVTKLFLAALGICFVAKTAVLGDVTCNSDQVVDNGVCVPKSCPDYKVEYKGMAHYLNPRIFENPHTLEEISESLHDGELVILRDAFLPEFAEAMYCDLATTKAFKLHTSFLEDAFHFSHHNIYDLEDYTQLMNETYAMFDHPDSKAFMQDLTGRDCSGERTASASYYHPGDHSLPHTDHLHQRTVAYVWHLSKNWQPEWGGALYWVPEEAHHAYVHASYNTLSLFSVHADTPHFVTTVSPQATEKRLSFNGWWTSSWIPSLDDNLEELLATEEQRWDLTYTQIDTLRQLVDSEDSDLTEERRDLLRELTDQIEVETFPPEAYSKLELE